MSQVLRVAVAGLGRMGPIHALHVHELEQETGSCTLAALVDTNIARAREVANGLGISVPAFASIEEMLNSGLCDATVVVTPTGNHRRNAEELIAGGHRVLLEKPLTGTLAGDREFAAELDRSHPDALMLAFQRRFDPPLQYVKQLIDAGLVGRVFKVYSALEDSCPAPDGYRSGGILPDMAVHNVDELLWLTGQVPERALAIGSRISSYRRTTADEDFDDALLYLWFPGELTGQIQVSRNHVSGYRVETTVFGEEGQIQVGRFDQQPFAITVQAFGRRGSPEPLAHEVFPMRDYRRPLPEFIDRFGFAYKAEVAAFVECCRANAPFPATHRDGVRAQEVISAGMECVIGAGQAAAVRQS